MSNIKISEMAEAESLNDNDLLTIVQSGVNKKITKQNAIGDIIQAINNPTYTTTEGTNLSINNTRVGKMKFEYFGNTEQNGEPTPDNPVEVKTVTGENIIQICRNNLFDYSKARVRTIYSYATTNLFSAGADNTSVSINNQNVLSGTANPWLAIAIPFNFEANKTIYNNGYTGAQSILVYDKNGDVITNIPPPTISYTPSTSFNGYLGLGLQSAVNVTGEKIMFSYENNANFEPYQSQSYEINLGKNLIPKPQKINETVTNTVTSNGITCTVIEGGHVKVYGTASAQADFYMFRPVNEGESVIVPTGNYTFSSPSLPSGVKIITSGGGGNNGFAYTELNSTNLIATSTVTSGTKPFNFFMVRVANGTSINQDIYFQLEKGSQATSFAPYFTPIELCKIGDYQDYIHDNGGKWFKHKEVGKTIDSSGSTGITINEMVNNGSIFSYCGGTVNAKTITYASAISTTNYIYYQLATPIEEEITEPTLINQLNAIKYGAESYYGQTNIMITSADLKLILKVQTLDKIGD